MPVVLDSNAAIALALQESAAERVIAQMSAWLEDGVALHAPALFAYEVANVLSGSIFTGALAPAGLEPALRTVAALPIQFHQQDHDLEAVVAITRAMGRRSAYDATYLALGVELGATVWTLDRALYRNAFDIGYDIRHFALGQSPA